MPEGFTTSFSVEQSPQEAFRAITDVRGWWSQRIDGPTDELDKEFTYRVEDIHVCRIRVTELVPAERVTWSIVDNYFNFTEDRTEWTGTTIRFEISAVDGRTQVRFTHEGLVPEFECFDICTNAWGEYINGSLRNLITTGVGQPNSFEGEEAIEVVRGADVAEVSS